MYGHAMMIRERDFTMDMENGVVQSIAFGTWLVQQKGRNGFVGGLADAAAADRTFPRLGDVAAAREWLMQRRASGDDWEALDDAELDWASL
ncbi:hypothetical protein GCM10017612_06590 [Novosphingobium resinovorum]|nr:hypothetical protein GCM10017612_06590 [Novosphingobium resinovorum]